MTQPAHISIVAGGEGAAAAPSSEPEAQSPQTLGIGAPPPDPVEETKDVGGPTLPNPTPEAKATATGGGLADRMAARMARQESTKEFGVPGWELEDGSPGLIVVAKTFGDRKGYAEGLSNEAFIAKSTYKLVFVNDDGTREEIPGRWGPQLAKMVGGVGKVTKAADLVALVISKPDPDHEGHRIPNVAAIGGLANQIVNWASSGVTGTEEMLGE